MNAKSWNQALQKYYSMTIKPAPCEDCEHRQKCKEQLLACDAFNAYVQRNQTWTKGRTPTRHIWNKIFVYDRYEEDTDEEDNKP
jgi:hypothetical protein